MPSSVSILRKQQHMRKLKYSFECYADTDSKKIHTKQSIQKFLTMIGLSNQLFYQHLYYFFPQIKSHPTTCSISFDDCLSLIDYILCKKQGQSQKQLQSFKVFDKNGNGQVNTNDLLPVLKKHLSPKEYQMYSQIITQSYGPSINYLELINSTNQKKY